MRSLQWDIFCKVIDNFGDIGICWRLACDLASRGQQVRLWADDASALAWMAPQGCEGVTVLDWGRTLRADDLGLLEQMPAGVLVETFGCDAAPEFIAACARHERATGHKPLWINLEYLTAEPFAERSHGLPSPVSSGPAAGWTKWFFFPGFTPASGGLLREPGLARRRAAFKPSEWLQQHGIMCNEDLLISLFCYEPPALAGLLQGLSDDGLDGRPVHLLVAAGRAQSAAEQALAGAWRGKGEHADSSPVSPFTSKKGLQPNVDRRGMLSISYLPWLAQTDFDHLLWSADLNFVRGEDSIVRALWAGKPFVWQIYPQDDGAHRAKLDAFLDMMQAPPSLRAFHHLWNAGAGGSGGAGTTAGTLGPALAAWSQAAQETLARLERQDDLVSRLMNFAGKKR